MSQSTHQIAITGRDQTAGAFQSIQARAVSAGSRISKVMGGAIAAAGAYLSFRAVKNGIDELGNLSDMAMKAGTSVESLTQTSLALQVAGLDLPVESLAKSFQYLAKQTGEGGFDHFFKTLTAISQIEDPAKRGAELVKNFGRSGMELQPLIDGGQESIEKMRSLAEVMPGVSQAAANAGDNASDALKTLGTGVHAVFLEVVGDITRKFAEDFPGGVQAGAMSASNWLKYLYEKYKAYSQAFGFGLVNIFLLIKDGFVPGLQLFGASIAKVFSVAVESLKWVGTSIKSVMMLAVDLVREGPSVAWKNFTDEMSAANERWTDNLYDSSKFDRAISDLKYAHKKYAEAKEEIDTTLNDRIAAADKKRAEYLDKLRQNDIDKLANPFGNKERATFKNEETESKKPPRITNELITGGSNAQQKLAILGPNYQNETKRQTAELIKQNETLQKIAENTRKTADETGVAVYNATDFGA